jgi:hypothetical protein
MQRVVMYLHDGRQLDLTGLSDEDTIWRMRRVATTADIASTRHSFPPSELGAAVILAQRLERLWLARWN